MQHAPPPPPPAPGWHSLAWLWAGLSGAVGLGLLACALASPAWDGTTRAAAGAAGSGLFISALVVWQLLKAAQHTHAATAQAHEAAHTANAQLRATLDILPDGLALFDADDRLVLCNTRYREVAPGATMDPKNGTLFEDVLRHAAESGQIIDALSDIPQWLADRMARHRAPGPPELQHLAGDRWM